MQIRLALALAWTFSSVALAEPGGADWKKQVEATANSADQERHASIVKTLGKPIKIAFDWKSFKASDWSRLDPDFVVGRCLYDPADVFSSMAKKPEYKAALSRLEVITCRPATTAQVKGAAVYRLADGGKALEIDYCDSCSHGPLEQVLEDGLQTGGDGGSAHEAAWRTHTMTYANNQAEDAAESQSAGAHEIVKSGCGHDVALTFDWATLAMKDWFERGNPGLHEQMLEWAGTEVLKNMGRACKDNAKYKKKLAKVKTLACHGTKHPPMLKQSGATGTEPGPKYKLAGSTLEVWLSPGVQLRDEYLEAALDRKH